MRSCFPIPVYCLLAPPTDISTTVPTRRPRGRWLLGLLIVQSTSSFVLDAYQVGRGPAALCLGRVRGGTAQHGDALRLHMPFYRTQGGTRGVGLGAHGPGGHRPHRSHTRKPCVRLSPACRAP